MNAGGAAHLVLLVPGHAGGIPALCEWGEEDPQPLQVWLVHCEGAVGGLGLSIWV